MTVELSGKEGYVNIQGEIVIPCIYDHAGRFIDGLASVRFNGYWGFVNKLGNVIVPFQYHQAPCDFVEGLSLTELFQVLTIDNSIKVSRKLGFIDKNGINVIPFEYDEAESFKDGLARVKLNGKWGVINKNGDIVVPLKYDSIEEFEGGYAKVGLSQELSSKEKFLNGFVDITGKEIIPCIFDEINFINEGLAAAKKGNKEGFIDINGNLVLACPYSDLNFFSKGLACIHQDIWDDIETQGLLKGLIIGYINKEGVEYWED